MNNLAELHLRIGNECPAIGVHFIYKLIGQDSLVISISNSNGGNQQPIRPVNFNVTEENENYVHTFTRVD